VWGGSTPSSFESFAFEAIPLPAKCLMEIMDCFDQAQGHNKLQKVTVGAHIIENMIVFTNLQSCCSFCNQTLLVHHHKLECLVKWLASLVKVKVTVMVENFVECLSVVCCLYHGCFDQTGVRVYSY